MHCAKGLHETIETVRIKLKPPASPKPADAKPADAAGTPVPSLPQPTPVVPSTPPPGPSLPMAPPATPPAAAAADKLWKRLGGEENVNKIVGDFLKWAVNDEKVNFTRGNKYPLDEKKLADLRQKFVAYVSDISGGPIVGTSTRSMADIHKGMNITDGEFDALVRFLKTALEKNNVAPADVEEVLRKVNATKKDIVSGRLTDHIFAPQFKRDQRPICSSAAVDTGTRVADLGWLEKPSAYPVTATSHIFSRTRSTATWANTSLGLVPHLHAGP